MEIVTQQITVIKPRWHKREYEFLAGKELAGRLKFTRNLNIHAEAQLFNEEWSVKKSGFWKTELEYKAAQRPFAKGKITMTASGKAQLSASDGKTYYFKKLKWWHTVSGWYNESNEPILELKPNYSFNNKQATLTIHHTKHPDVIIMIILAWFMYTVQQSYIAASAG